METDDYGRAFPSPFCCVHGATYGGVPTHMDEHHRLHRKASQRSVIAKIIIFAINFYLHVPRILTHWCRTIHDGRGTFKSEDCRRK